MDKIQAILLAGGRGTRLAPLTDTLPKPLVPILGRPMIEYVFEHLKAAGITNIAISVAYLGHLIEEAYGNGEKIGMQITYLKEPEMMGTAGWMRLIDKERLADRFIVANADNFFWINIPAFLARHDNRGAVATIAGIGIPSESADNYEILATDEEKAKLHAYVDRKEAGPLRASSPTVFVSSGWYVMTPEVISHAPDVLPLSHEHHIWPTLSASGKPLAFYEGTEPWFDSGTHERLARVEDFLKKRKGQE